MNHTIKHCCQWMDIFTKDPRVTVIYIPRYRAYIIPLSPKDKKLYPVTNGLRMEYCPWCAQKLPENLTDKWFEILENEYGLDDPDNQEQQKLVPDEFKTDEWWKKREL